MTALTTFIIGGLLGTIVGILLALYISFLVVADDADDYFDDSLERLNASLRHPSQRVP